MSKFVKQYLELVGSKKTYALEHGNMGHRTENIVFCKIHVHLAVLANCKLFNLRSHLDIFCPQFISHGRKRIIG